MNRYLLLSCLWLLAASPAKLVAQKQSERIYVSNERSGDVSVIDAGGEQVIATIPVGKRPRGIHMAPGGRRFYVALSGSPRMAPGVDQNRAPADKTADGLGAVDTTTGKVVQFFHVGSDPEQFAIDAEGRTAFISNEDNASASAVALATGAVIATGGVSDEPEGVGINPISGNVFITCEDAGMVYVLDPEQLHEITHFKVGGRPRSVVFTRDGALAYIPSESDALITVADALYFRVTATIKLDSDKHPMGTAISADGKEAYVTTGRGNSVEVIDTTANKVVASIPVGSRDWGIALNAAGDRLYTANGVTNDVSVVDVKTRKELKRIKVGDGPWGVAVGPAVE